MSNNFKRKGCDSESGSLTGTLAQSFSGKGIKEASRFLEESLQTPVSPAHQWPSALPITASFQEKPMNLLSLR